MKQLFLIVGFFALVLALSGCTTNQNQVVVSPYIGGTTGLQVSFTPQAPPDEIYDGGNFPFDVDVKLKNVGEYTIPQDKVTVTLRGIYPQDYGKTAADFTKSPSEDIIGARKDITGRIIDGIETHVVFDNLNYQGSIAGAMESITLQADACYEYQTETTSSLCVRENLLTSKSGICEVNAIKPTANSGAPIHIENLQESAVASDKLSFTFDVVHKGNGKFFDPNGDCVENYQNEDKVYVKVDPGFGTIQCSGFIGTSGSEGLVRMSNGKGTVRCTIQLSSDELGDYEKSIKITTTYKYRDRITKTLSLKHAGE